MMQTKGYPLACGLKPRPTAWQSSRRQSGIPVRKLGSGFAGRFTRQGENKVNPLTPTRASWAACATGKSTPYCHLDAQQVQPQVFANDKAIQSR
jgi:hypothetical protein